MLEELNNTIAKSKEIIDTLPINNKPNKDKYNDFLESELKKANTDLEDTIKEIKKRVKDINDKHEDGLSIPNIVELNSRYMKTLDTNLSSKEKMNLSSYFYQLEYFYKTDLVRVNACIKDIIIEFEKVGVKLTPTDFNFSDTVQNYMTELFKDNRDMAQIFDNIYWENTNLISIIVLNLRHLYLKYENTINKYYSKLSKTKAINEELEKYYNSLEAQKRYIHGSKSYLYNLFMDKNCQVSDYQDKAINELIDIHLQKPENPDNYNNLIKLESSLINYRDYLEFEDLVHQTIELKKESDQFKGKYAEKIKEISKKESELFKVNKTINKKFLKPSREKLRTLNLKRTNIFGELNNLYKELDDLEIYESLIDYITDESSYLDILRTIRFNFNYIAKLLKKNDENITYDQIVSFEDRLGSYIYRNDLYILRNMTILEKKDIPSLIRDRFAMTNLLVDVEQLNKDSIDSVIDNINHLILRYNLNDACISLDDIAFVLKVEKLDLDKQ